MSDGLPFFAGCCYPRASGHGGAGPRRLSSSADDACRPCPCQSGGRPRPSFSSRPCSSGIRPGRSAAPRVSTLPYRAIDPWRHRGHPVGDPEDVVEDSRPFLRRVRMVQCASKYHEATHVRREAALEMTRWRTRHRPRHRSKSGRNRRPKGRARTGRNGSTSLSSVMRPISWPAASSFALSCWTPCPL